MTSFTKLFTINHCNCWSKFRKVSAITITGKALLVAPVYTKRTKMSNFCPSDQNVDTETNNLKRRVLSIQSHVVSGYVGNKCAVFPLQVLGFDVDFINSVQFTNHTQYDSVKGQILNSNDLDDLLVGLRDNDLLDYSHILTGYVGSESFLLKIAEVIKEVKSKCPGAIYLCDPVLGDNGKFYVPKELIPIYQKEVLPLADITTPNTFELELLSDRKISNEQEALEAMDVVHNMGVSIVVLSSLDSSGPELITYVSSKNLSGTKEREVWKIQSVRKPGIFTGTGDLFSALFLGWHSKLNGSISKALEGTLATMNIVLKRTMEKRDRYIKEFGGGDTKKALSLSGTQASKSCEMELIRSLEVIKNPWDYVEFKAVKIL